MIRKKKKIMGIILVSSVGSYYGRFSVFFTSFSPSNTPMKFSLLSCF